MYNKYHMKTSPTLLKVFFVLFLALTLPRYTHAQPVTVSVQVFYDELSPYGHWVNYPNYGYVWIPFVGVDFMPYSTGGYWTYTMYGWTWVSTYRWGWAPFHYGRWDFDPYYGWFWVPGYEWGPAWVIWRRCPGYYGWTYLRPGHNHRHFSDNSYYGPRKNDWTFIEDKNMGRENSESHYAPRTNNESLISNSTIIDNTYEDKAHNVTYIKGPSKEEFEKNTGIAIKTVTIEENSKPAQIALSNDKLSIYRPTVVKASSKEAQPAPAKITDLKDIKPVSERNAAPQQEISPKELPVKEKAPERSIKEEQQPAKTQPTLPEKPKERTDEQIKQDKILLPAPSRQKDTEHKPSEPKIQPKAEPRVQQAPKPVKVPSPSPAKQQVPGAGKKVKAADKQQPRK